MAATYRKTCEPTHGGGMQRHATTHDAFGNYFIIVRINEHARIHARTSIGMRCSVWTALYITLEQPFGDGVKNTNGSVFNVVGLTMIIF